MGGRSAAGSSVGRRLSDFPISGCHSARLTSMPAPHQPVLAVHGGKHGARVLGAERAAGHGWGFGERCRRQATRGYGITKQSRCCAVNRRAVHNRLHSSCSVDNAGVYGGSSGSGSRAAAALRVMAPPTNAQPDHLPVPPRCRIDVQKTVAAKETTPRSRPRRNSRGTPSPAA